MADLFALLGWSAASLQAHSALTATASHNLSNANTPGYARQRANLAATLPAFRMGTSFVGRGAALARITQARDPIVERQLPEVLGGSARADARARSLEGLSALDPDGGAGLTAALGGFYAALRQLAQTPSDLGSRQALVGTARNAALAFNRAAGNLADARTGIDTALGTDAQHVNELARTMAGFNRQIRIELASGGLPNDLLDARQGVQDQLVALTGAFPVPDSDGNVNLQLPAGGGALVAGDLAAVLSTQPDPANGGHLALLIASAGGSVPVAVGAGRVGGTLGGLLDGRDGALQAAETAVDQLAFDWASAINTVHQAGFGLDGVSGRDLFTVSATVAGAARGLVVNASVLADPRQVAAASSAATLPGDAANLFAVIQTEAQALSGGGDVFSTLSSTIASYGSAAQGARTDADRFQAVKEQLTTLRESTSGVSIDEELVALTQAQRGYEAVMKVVKTTDEMLQTLLDLK